RSAHAPRRASDQAPAGAAQRRARRGLRHSSARVGAARRSGRGRAAAGVEVRRRAAGLGAAHAAPLRDHQPHRRGGAVERHGAEEGGRGAMTRGVLSIVLHAHLPYVRHPEYPEFLEEDWLYEAITETYLPLLEVFDRCVEDGVPFRITLTLTPPLVGMLRDELLVSRYAKRLDLLCELCDKE